MPNENRIPLHLYTIGIIFLVGLAAIVSILLQGTSLVTLPNETLVGQAVTTAMDVRLVSQEAVYTWEDIPFPQYPLTQTPRVFENIDYLPGTNEFVIGGICNDGRKNAQYAGRFGLYIISDDGTFAGKRDACADGATLPSTGCGAETHRCTNIATNSHPIGDGRFVREMSRAGTFQRSPTLYDASGSGVEKINQVYFLTSSSDSEVFDSPGTRVERIAVANNRMIAVTRTSDELDFANAIYTLPDMQLVTRFSNPAGNGATNAKYTPLAGVGQYFIANRGDYTNNPSPFAVYRMPASGTAEPQVVQELTGKLILKYTYDSLNPERIAILWQRMGARSIDEARLPMYTDRHVTTYIAGPDGLIEESTVTFHKIDGTLGEFAIAGDYMAYSRCATNSAGTVQRDTCRIYVTKGTAQLQVEQLPQLNGKRRIPLDLAISARGRILVHTHDTLADMSDKDTFAQLWLLEITGFTGGGGPGSPETPRVFIDDRDTPGVYELYAETGAGIIKLSVPLSPTGRVWMFNITPDGQRVVYTADDAAITNERNELFVVPITGGPSTKLSGPAHAADRPQANVILFIISPDGQRVAYAADPNTWSMYELYTVPITGGQSTRVSHALPADHDVDDFLFSPDSGRVVYRAGRTSIGKWELYAAPSAGGSATRLSQAWGSESYIYVERGGFTVSCDSQTVYYLADTFGDGSRDEQYSVPITGGTITPQPGSQLPLFSCSAPAPGPTCKPVGAACVAYSECCTQTCSVGACISLSGTPPPTPCTDECTAGAPQCVGAATRTCGNYDSDSCLEWRTTPCDAGTSCQDGACVASGNYCNQQPRTRCSDEPVGGATRIGATCPTCTISPCPPAGTPPPKCYQCPEGQEPMYDYTTGTASCIATNPPEGYRAQTGVTATFTAETATCVAPSTGGNCVTTISWSSTGEGMIQLWRDTSRQVSCTPAGEHAAKYVFASPEPREYRLYAAASCDIAAVDIGAPLDKISVYSVTQ